MKTLTLTIPSYNMEAYLPQCLGSLEVGAELMERLEVLVVNDGSKDATSEVAHRYEAKWPGTVKVIDKKNGNYGSCINAALAAATGKYVKVLDADDSFDTEVFAGYLRALEGRDEDLVLNDFDFVRPDGSVKATVEYGKIGRLDGFTFEGDDSTPWMHGFAYRTEIFKGRGYRQSEGLSYTDQEWVAIPAAWVKSVGHVKGRLYRYLVGREGQTCEPAVYAKQIPQQMKITRRLMENFRSAADVGEENREYLWRHLKSRVRAIYRVATLHATPETDIELGRFDDELKSGWKELWDEADRLLAPSKVKFHCVREWRKNRNDRTLKFRLFKLYLMARGVKRQGRTGGGK